MLKAKWIRKTHLLRPDEYICSDCGRSFAKPYARCPSCGASMGRTKYDASWVDEIEGFSAIFED